MDFPKDFEIQGPWVPVTPTKPILMNRSSTSGSSWLVPDEVLAGMNGGSGNSWDPANWSQPTALSSASQPTPVYGRNGGELHTQAFNNHMQMPYRTLLALSDPNITSNTPNLAPFLFAQMSSRGGGGRQMMPPATPHQSHRSGSQMMPSASPRMNQLAQIIAARGIGSSMMRPVPPRQNQFLLSENTVPPPSVSSSNSQQSWVQTPNSHRESFFDGMPIPLLANFNSVPETNTTNVVVSKSVTVVPMTPANLVKNTGMQDFQRPVEIIDLVEDTTTFQNVRQNELCTFRQTAAEESVPGFSNQGVSNVVSLQTQEGEATVMPSAEAPLQQVEGENQGIDLNKTPEPKLKRKKHRPKVIKEGKPKTPKPVTPKLTTPRCARKTEDPPRTKRKYVRKNKDINSAENPSDSLGKIVDPMNGSASKPVRRNLNFDIEDCQAGDDRAGLEEMALTHNADKSDVQSAHGRGGGNSFDLNSSTNQFNKEYSSDPQIPNPPLQHSRQGAMQASQIRDEYIRMLNNVISPPQLASRGENLRNLARMHNYINAVGNNQSARDKICEVLLKGTKRDRGLVDDAEISGRTSQVPAYNATNMRSENGMHSPEIYKRPRIEDMQNEGTSSPYSPGGPRTVQAAQNRYKALSLADAQRFMAYKKLRVSERMLMSNNVQNHASCTPLKAVEHQRASAPVIPSGHGNAGCYHPPTHTNCDGTSIGPQARIEALIASNRLKPKARARRRKEDVVVNSDEAAFSTTDSNRNNSQLRIACIQDCQATSNSKSGTVIPYTDPIEEMIQKLHRLSINGGNEDFMARERNALVPYVGGVGTIVPFEGKKRKPRPKVDLDPESDRVWRLLMGGEGDGEMGLDKEKWWEEERRIFRGRADSFIARMHLIQGDRRFSKWKGSVVDSVIGVFLTQNVSDHLSSSAFMSLVARFSPSSGDKNTTHVEQINRPIPSDNTISEQGNISYQQSCDPSLGVINEAMHMSEKETASNHESPESNTGSSTLDYLDGTHLDSHEGELGIGRESPNGSATAITVTGSTSGVSTEDVVSSQISVASGNFANHDQGKLNSLLNFDADDLLSGGMGNGFNSFTELLKMANSRGIQEMNVPGNVRTSSTKHNVGINQFGHMGFGEMPPFPYSSDCLFGSSRAPSLSSYYQNCEGLESVGIVVEGNLYNASTIAKTKNSTKGEDCHMSLTSRVASVGTHAPIIERTMQPVTSSGSGTCAELNSCCQNYVDQTSNKTISSRLSLSSENTAVRQQKESEATCQAERIQHGVKAQTPQTCSKEQNNSNNNDQEKVLEGIGEVKPNLRKEAFVAEASKAASKAKKLKQEADKKKSFDWDSLRKQSCSDGVKKERSHDAMDSLDYEALRNADVNVIAHAIRERGMNNMLAERIKEFLNRLVRDHGSVDLEWLRDVPPDKAKDYLLSIRGLGLKSVECVRLLTLHHLAFPVDTNVGRICVRLGWVPLQPLPESLQLHLLEMYPLLETIQKYLWPRLCKLDQRTLYELHYQLITFGKVFCTKSKPNCNACPMRGECKHFASAFARVCESSMEGCQDQDLIQDWWIMDGPEDRITRSCFARLALTGPEEKGLVTSTTPTSPEKNHAPVFKPMPLPQLDGSTHVEGRIISRNCEPIIEEPASPEPESECVGTLESEIEDAFFLDDPEEIPAIQLNMEEFTQNLQSYMQENNMELQDGDMSRALIAIAPESASIPMPKLKNVSRLRTEHQVYELPDSHPLLEGLDKRERDDPSPYLLAIWTPGKKTFRLYKMTVAWKRGQVSDAGETAQSTEPPKVCCNSQATGKLCGALDCFSCNSIRETEAQLVRGTILIPCRTAMRGSFPLNGTYFQVNEVFADHDSSRIPIDVPRSWIWNLPRRTVYFGTSVTTIFKGLTTEGIQHCFWRGFVCVRGFDKSTRSPRPLYARLHLPPSKTARDKKTEAASAVKSASAAKPE